MNRMTPQFPIVLFQLKSFGPLGLFRDSVISEPGFSTFQPNEFSCHLPTLNPINSNTDPTEAAALPPLPSKYRPTRPRIATVVRTQSKIFVTTPEPTVLPPSRIANRILSVMAIGLPSSTCMVTLSPGMHISAPPSRVVAPVTSVVRK